MEKKKQKHTVAGVGDQTLPVYLPHNSNKLILRGLDISKYAYHT